ncbi:hypothetical protein EV702DRAFT_1018819 [Suillus placidus]|uniref:Uncharacterized protein n=1 Tax=Suillus placidus TaxID=48579 RepID=A0A9P6ZFU3_9AGAM|nr:hypothetical protein EV702DRAFT_1037615 [Suillus placidus]KAG1763989.1 hypothetical protein EV702DRAFT_1037503 [Suillus placidus]KAG1769126.1 hypothetical protein EV702DRAFT_1035210 [Suillus placidus]KAG1779245.1 hypothetical protein EV702DRAFT_1025016 [Suillus placidus]KAG1783399.1 hypothetical protein EV702DRAFT_1019801 [Suillus placidus]
MSASCPACGQDNLTVTGLSHHLSKSRNPDCRALYNHSRSQIHANTSEPQLDDELEWPDNDGGYDMEEFEWAREGSGHGSDADEGADDGWDDEANNEPEWEPPVDQQHDHGDMDAMDDLAADEATGQEQRHGHQEIQERAQGQHGCVIAPYPDSRAGQPISNNHTANVAYGAHLSNADQENTYHPFASKMDWEVARWAKLRGLSSTALSDLLAIEGVSECLSLSFKNANELNAIVDRELPTGRPKFKREQIIVAGEAFDVYYRDVIECVKSLYSDPDFARYLAFVPERHYADEDETVRLFHDMHTGKWWWDTQPSRGAHILLAYLPCTRLDHISNKASRRRTLANLYHACMSRVLAPLKSVGLDGITMASGDGTLRRCHLLFASFVGDYPEQLLATGIKFGECPKCDIEADETGSNTAPYHLRRLREVLDALATLDEGSMSFVRACSAAGIKPIIHPFWEDLPFANVFRAITPDVLHQLYQGLVKHLLGWLKAACGAAEIDARCRRLPPNHHIRLFTKGITGLSRISGTEHSQICRFLLGIVIGIRLPNNLNANRLLRAVHGLLDFLYLAQYPCHSSETLQLLNDALGIFHENKDIFVDLGIRDNFNLPKLHATRHYSYMIMMLGTTDNYNTEYTERLHIDYAKDAYHATNHKDEFAQMTRWLERKEKILRHDKYVNWRLAGDVESEPHHSRPPDMTFRRLQTMPKHPTAKAVTIDRLVDDYGATFFREALARYITQLRHAEDPNPLHERALEILARDIHFPFRTLPVFHKIKWVSVDSRGHGDATVTLDSVHVRPQRRSGSGLLPRRSDTVLVNLGVNTEVVSAGIEALRVGQVRVVFSLPSKSLPLLFPPTVQVPSHLAYIEWFSPFALAPDRHHGLYKVSRSFLGGAKVASIVPLSKIVRSAHLLPNFGAVVPREWSSDTVLDDCDTFWLNSYLDRFTYCIFK